jgi:predicted TIM-barrel fold metal-dependent hydrolase
MRVVDHQTHWFPPTALEALVGRTTLPRVEKSRTGYVLEIAEGARLALGPELVDLDVQLRAAEAHGVDVLVSSPVTLGEVMHLEGSEAAELLDELNAEAGRTQREHAGRFVGLAMLPLHDTARALEVLDRAILEHDLRGVCVLASIEGAPIGTEDTLPVFRRIEQLGVPVFLHPAVRSRSFPGAGRIVIGGVSWAEAGIGWMYETALAAVSLVDGGVLDTCPALEVVHPHLGGVLPYVVGRLDRMRPPELRSPMREYLRTRFYTDTVGATPGALQLAASLYGRDRLLFATDFPFVPMAPGHDYVTDGVEAGLREAILGNRLPTIARGPGARPPVA